MASVENQRDSVPLVLIGEAPSGRTHLSVSCAQELQQSRRVSTEAGTVQLSPAGGLRPHSYVTLWGLLACTGLRIAEALALTCADVDLAGGMLTVRAGKRGLTRLVPLHPTAAAA